MSSDLPSEKYGRGMRQTRQSLRAKEAAGLDDASIKQLSRPSNGTADPSVLSQSSSESTQPYSHNPLPAKMTAGKTPVRGRMASSGAIDYSKMQTPDNATLSEKVASSIEAQSSQLQSARDVPALATDFATASQTKQPSLHSPAVESQYRASTGTPMDSAQPSPSKPPAKVTKSTKSNKRKTSKQARPVPQRQLKEAPTVKKDIQNFVTDDPQLQAARFHIYQWARPIPTDFFNLSKDWNAAKARVDAEEGERDDAPELDDWHEFCGLDNMLCPIPLKTAVGLNFISRAKRAFRAGRSFASFEQEERTIDSRAGAMAIRDPHERAVALSSALRNADRMYVYNQIKVRLCHEIWLQPYPEGEYLETARFEDAAASFNEADPSSHQSQQSRTEPELPGQFRELHQPHGPPPRMSYQSISGLGEEDAERLNNVSLRLEISDSGAEE